MTVAVVSSNSKPFHSVSRCLPTATVRRSAGALADWVRHLWVQRPTRSNMSAPSEDIHACIYVIIMSGTANFALIAARIGFARGAADVG